MKIVSTSPVPPVAQELFRNLGGIEVRPTDDPTWRAEVETLVLRAGTVGSELLDAAPRLRIVARTGAGFDAIDVAEATKRGVAILYAPNAGVTPVAEGALALILATTKRLQRFRDILHAGAWDDRYAPDVRDLDGAVLGLVGCGRIGQAVGRLGGACGMSVIACDPNLSAADVPSWLELHELEHVLAHADVLSVHAALNDTTRGLLTRERLGAMKRGAVLINVARGEIIESDEVLIEALDSGQLSAVGLDVFSAEPPSPTSRLLVHPDVVCTPHAVGLTAQWNHRVFASLADDVGRLLSGVRPTHIVNPEVLSDGRSPTVGTTSEGRDA